MKNLVVSLFCFGVAGVWCMGDTESVDVSKVEAECTVQVEAETEAEEVLTLDLPTALRVVDERNTDLAISVERVYQAELAEDAAWYQWLPTVRVGLGYTYQNGALQDAGGQVENVDRDASSAGLGIAQTGAGLPAYPGVSMEVDIADALYAPRVAHERLRASEAERDEVAFVKTLDVIDAYYELVLAEQAIQIEEQALREAASLEEATGAFASAGEGLAADSDRSAVEKLLRDYRLEAARTRRENACAKLARLLNLRETVVIRSAESGLVPLELLDTSLDSGSMVAMAMENRTAIKLLQYRLNAKRLETKQSEVEMFIPKLGASYSYGAFGGGSGHGSHHSDARHDVSVAVYWEIENLGFLNRSNSLRRGSEARALRNRLEQARTDVATEIRMALTELSMIERQLVALREGVSRARTGYELNRQRIFENQGLPLEALTAFQSLAEVELLYAQTVSRYNQVQLYLLHATGQQGMAVTQ